MEEEDKEGKHEKKEETRRKEYGEEEDSERRESKQTHSSQYRMKDLSSLSEAKTMCVSRWCEDYGQFPVDGTETMVEMGYHVALRRLNLLTC